MKKAVGVVGLLALLGAVLLALSQTSAVDPDSTADLRNYGPSSTYDAFEDDTSFSVHLWLGEYSDTNYDLDFRAWAKGKSDRIGHGEAINVAISVRDQSNSPGYGAGTVLPLMFLVDETRRIDPARFEDRLVIWELTQDELRVISEAQTVRVRIDAAQFTMSEPAMSRLREFAEYLPN